jgi:biopolymer transport protein ExbD
MKVKLNNDLPPAFIDLAFVQMVVWMLIAISLTLLPKIEITTPVDLAKVEAYEQSIEGGVTKMALTISKDVDSYSFTLESKKIQLLKLQTIDAVIEEIKRLHPPELTLRIDKEAPSKFEQKVMYHCNKLGIKIGFNLEEE